MKQAVWFLSMFCPNGCSHCSSGDDAADRRALGPGQARKLMRRLAAGGVEDIKLAGGEPFLYRDLVREIIEPGNAMGLLFDIASSGVGVRERDLAALLASRHNNQLTLSLDGDCPAVNDAIRFAGSFARVSACLEAIKAGLGRKRTALSIVVRHTVTPKNRRRVGRLLKFLDRYPVDAVLIGLAEPVGKAADGSAACPGTAAAALERSLRPQLKRHRFEIRYSGAPAGQASGPAPSKRSCFTGRVLCVDNLGRLLPCSHLMPGGALEKKAAGRLFLRGYSAPSLLRASVEQAFKSPLFRHFGEVFGRYKVKRMKLAECAACGYRDKCMLCPLTVAAAAASEKAGRPVLPCREF